VWWGRERRRELDKLIEEARKIDEGVKEEAV